MVWSLGTIIGASPGATSNDVSFSGQSSSGNLFVRDDLKSHSSKEPPLKLYNDRSKPEGHSPDLHANGVVPGGADPSGAVSKESLTTSKQSHNAQKKDPVGDSSKAKKPIPTIAKQVIKQEWSADDDEWDDWNDDDNVSQKHSSTLELEGGMVMADTKPVLETPVVLVASSINSDTVAHTPSEETTDGPSAQSEAVEESLPAEVPLMQSVSEPTPVQASSTHIESSHVAVTAAIHEIVDGQSSRGIETVAPVVEVNLKTTEINQEINVDDKAAKEGDAPAVKLRTRPARRKL